MGELNLCDRIIKLDRSIRFVGIVNNRGEVIGDRAAAEWDRGAAHVHPVTVEPNNAAILQR